MNNQQSNVYKLTTTALMTAIICILGPLSIPIGAVPISFTSLAIFWALYAVGMKFGTVGYVVYLLIGLCGVPVFSGFLGGPAKLFGPTGGYLIGFIFMAVISGWFIDRYPEQRWMCFLGMVIGTLVLYAFGTAWLAYQARLSFAAALAAGVLPFIPGDLIKIGIAAFIGPQIQKRLIRN